jgi:hypothetical protein
MKELEVYKITNKENGKIYIGITSQGVNQRWCKHCSDSTTGSTFPIHNAIRKYGKDISPNARQNISKCANGKI